MQKFKYPYKKYINNYSVDFMKNISKEQESKEINHSLNVLKCIAIFAVICIHCDIYSLGLKGQLIISFSRFAVPLFFLISGFYSFIGNDIEAISKYKMRIIRLLKLLIISNFIYFIYFCYISSDFNILARLISMFSISNCIDYIIFNISPTAEPLWFIQALIYCYIIFLLMRKMNINHNKLYVFIPILLLGSILIGEISNIMGTHFESMFYRNFLFLGLPFFTLGYLIHEKKEMFTKIKDKYIYCIIILSSCLTIIETVKAGRASIYVGMIFLTIMLFVWCVKYPNKLDFKIMGWIGGTLYPLMYVLHPMVLSYLNFTFKLETSYFYPFIIFLLSGIISLIIYELMNIKKRI